ncbi:PH-like domain-containing protein [Lysinibacter cavernae]|uniref:PH domain-containing protein n=1 Tax=Lysinibacter cavernae TaxID=1640652 RepID=A0A7X5TSR3_9MICO|nr:hypothetical protein [Lysinibacter cavernae]NIH52719.1 hypothetical protein [Lysinibacter cavernae]
MGLLGWGLVVAAFVALLFLVMWFAWRARSKRSSYLSEPDRELKSGDLLCEIKCFYASTTTHGQPLERLVVPSLGFRGNCVVTVTTSGAMIRITGELPVAIRRSKLRGIHTAQVTIDKAVERDGLVAIEWMLAANTGDDVAVDSYVRVTDPADRNALIAAVNQVLPHPATAS